MEWVKRIVLGIMILVQMSVAHGQMVRTSFTTLFTAAAMPGSSAPEAFSLGIAPGLVSDSLRYSILFRGERKFGLEGLDAYQVAANFPLGSGCLGISGSLIGSGGYGEGSMSLGYALKLGSKVTAGLQFNRFTAQTKGHEARSSVNVEGGVQLQVTSALHFGLQLYNPTRSGWSGGAEERLPRIYSILIHYGVSEKLLLHAGLRKIEDATADMVGGFVYAFAPTMVARAGIEAATGAIFLGWGLRLGSLWFYINTALHPQLGLTPALMITHGGAKR